ncbi:MAG: FIST C-terminal domain-containing protein [Alphaproteobacteria bacterium]|nr:FIST C-terminal domain-containing protein [Alphaproteobacteria bacterium]MCB9975377.1 FIST C-terminal domain-containing protein [Rhodospirillales bacterium]
MKVYSKLIEGRSGEDTITDLREISPDIVFVFFSPEQAGSSVLKMLCESFKDIPVVGCSTAGEISDGGVSEGTLSVMAIHFENTPVRVAGQPIKNADECYEKARLLAQNLLSDDLSGVFVLAPGLNVNGSAIAKGLVSVLGSEVPVSGGLAGDKTNFSTTYTLLNGVVSENTLVAVGFYGPHIRIGTGSKGGWAPFGAVRRVTKSDGNILYELDDKPALDLYVQYLGDKAEQLPSSGLLYPFSILEDDQSETGLIRTILDVDYEKKSLTLAGDMPQGKFVRLMHADVDLLIEGAENAAQEAQLKDGDKKTRAAFLVSCVGRKIVMSDDVIEEVEAVQSFLGPETALSGFYSYGEICNSDITKTVELHNQTMTITVLFEVT